MRALSIVSKNGQITIPKKIREDFDLKEGSIVRFVYTTSNKLILKKVTEDDRKRS